MRFAPTRSNRKIGSWCSAPFFQLSSKQAIAIGMAVHELMTNAAKHGALSVEGERIEVTTERERTSEGAVIKMQWNESGGPPIEEPPVRSGFGSIVLNRVLISDLGADVEMRSEREEFSMGLEF